MKKFQWSARGFISPEKFMFILCVAYQLQLRYCVWYSSRTEAHVDRFGKLKSRGKWRYCERYFLQCVIFERNTNLHRGRLFVSRASNINRAREKRTTTSKLPDTNKSVLCSCISNTFARGSLIRNVNLYGKLSSVSLNFLNVIRTFLWVWIKIESV